MSEQTAMQPYDQELASIENQLIPIDGKQDYFKGVFSDIRRGKGGGFNSNAFMWSFAWPVYRKCPLMGGLLTFISAMPFIFGILAGMVGYFAVSLLIAFAGNGWYHSEIRAKAQTALALQGEEREAFIGRHRGTDMAMAGVSGFVWCVLVAIFWVFGLTR